jgi:hypothetical protein
LTLGQPAELFDGPVLDNARVVDVARRFAIGDWDGILTFGVRVI